MSDSSIDHNELLKFNKTADEWQDKDGEFSMLHKINPIRLEYIKYLINHYLNDKNDSIKVLDIGCGGGLVTTEIAKMGFAVTAIDANKSNIDGAILSSDNSLNIEYITSTVEEHIGNKYEVILCLEVIEHVANQELFLQNIIRLLKPGGIVILSTINRTMKALLSTILIAEYVLAWLPQGTHIYSKFIKPSEIVDILDKSDVNLLEMKGLTFSPLSCKWHLSENIDINYFISFAKMQSSQ